MLLIKHRVNQIKELSSIDQGWGVEIDLRSDPTKPGALYLHHDPWSRGDSFDLWLQEFSARGIRGPLILNMKEDGLEEAVLSLISRQSIRNFFFLDSALPTLVKWTVKKKNPHFAVRLSAYERIDSLKCFEGLADWVWVDCFDGVPVAEDDVRLLQSRFKICLVSPELQGKLPADMDRFGRLATYADAVCTKDPRQWEEFFRQVIKTAPPQP